MKDSSYTTYNNFLASTVLAMCVLSAMGIGIWIFVKDDVFPKEPTQIVIKYVAVSDSLSLEEKVSNNVNTRYIISQIERQQENMQQTYDALIKAKEEEGRINSLITLIIGVFGSILAFFGFRSFESIKEKAKQIAEDNTEIIAKDKAKEVAKYEANEIASQVAERVAERKAITVAENKAKATVNTYLDEKRKQLFYDAAADYFGSNSAKYLKRLVLDDVNPMIEKRVEEFLEKEKINELRESVEKCSTLSQKEIEKLIQNAVSDQFGKMIKAARQERNANVGKRGGK